MDFIGFFLLIDKQKHISISFLLIFIIFFIRTKALKGKGFLKQISFSVRDVFIIGISKEIIDLFGFGNPEFLDLFADSLGIILPFYLYYLYREGKKVEEKIYIKYEIKVLNKLKYKYHDFLLKLLYFIKINFNIIFYKRKILYYIPKIGIKILIKKSFYDLIHILKYSIIFSIIWSLNILIMILEIPFFAFYDAINGIIRLIKFSIDGNKNDIKFLN